MFSVGGWCLAEATGQGSKQCHAKGWKRETRLGFWVTGDKRLPNAVWDSLWRKCF